MPEKYKTIGKLTSELDLLGHRLDGTDETREKYVNFRNSLWLSKEELSRIINKVEKKFGCSYRKLKEELGI